MITEDYHSRAAKNWVDFKVIMTKLEEIQGLYEKELMRVIEKENKIEELMGELRNVEMYSEEL
jgi:hypothetical protein